MNSKEPPKRVYSVRLHADLVSWIDAYADQVGVKRSDVIEACLDTLRKGRLWIEPDQRPNPFPGVRREILPEKPFGQQAGTYPHRKGDSS